VVPLMADQQADDERGSEVEDYTGEVPRPHASDAVGSAPAAGDAGSGLGDGDVADVDDVDEAVIDDELAASIFDVAALIAERDAMKELAMRVQADFENYRRRMASQHTAEVDRATGRLAEALLPVLDAAEAAYIQHPEEIGPLLNVLLGELRKQGLETLDIEDQAFDPEVADAVAHEPGDGHEVVVAEVLRSGYRWRGKTLRPAMVRTKDRTAGV
jgi:molecular chaperone GrpE